MALKRGTIWALFPLTILTMLPVTGVVPILKQLVQDHYRAGDLSTSLFMSINMIGALIAAPTLGWISDRYGATKAILIICALIDATLWWVFSLQPAFGLLMLLRLIEGAAHIGALSMLMAVMSRASNKGGKRARMAGLGGAVIFGVALGAPLGGLLGQYDLLLPLQAGSALMIVVALVSAIVIPTQHTPSHPDTLPSRPKLHAPMELRLPYLFGFIDRLTIGVFIIAFALYGASLGFGPQHVGLAIGVFMGTFTLLSYPMGKLADSWGLWRFLLIGSAAFGLAFAAVPWLDGPFLWLGMVICGVLSAVMFGPNLMLVVRGSTPETRASAMAGFNAAGSLGFLVGPLLAGGLLELFKANFDDVTAYRLVFAVAGAFEVLCVSWAIRLRRQWIRTEVT